MSVATAPTLTSLLTATVVGMKPWWGLEKFGSKDVSAICTSRFELKVATTRLGALASSPCCRRRAS